MEQNWKSINAARNIYETLLNYKDGMAKQWEIDI